MTPVQLKKKVQTDPLNISFLVSSKANKLNRSSPGPNMKQLKSGMIFFFFFFKLYNYLFIYLFICGCVGSSFLCEGFLQSRQVRATLHRGAQAFHHRGLSCCGLSCCGLSCCGAQAPDAQAQQLWPTGPIAPRHAGSSQTRARTRVPRIGRQTLNHCATREAPKVVWFLSNCSFFIVSPPFFFGCNIFSY